MSLQNTKSILDAIGEVIQHDSRIISTLKKVVDNIIRDPEEMKYRSLPLSNKLVIERILQAEGAVELLSSIGFVQQYVEDSDTEYFVLHDEDVDMPVLKYASEMLERLSNQTTTATASSSSASSTSSDEEYNKRMVEVKARQEMIKKKLEEDAFRKELNKKRLMEQQMNLRDQGTYISASTLANNGFRTPGSRASNIKGYKDIGVDLNCKSG